ncbi:hypothetical protein Gpo141_00012475 [Globisporangium polare]
MEHAHRHCSHEQEVSGTRDSAPILLLTTVDPPQQQQQQPKPRHRPVSSSRAVKGASPRASWQLQQSQSRTAAAPRIRAKRSRNPSRERLQSELKQLRGLCDELAQRLDDLQQHEGERPQCHEEELAMRTAWEYIAKCQQHKRTRAEEENAQLRAQVQDQLVALKNLQQAASQVSGLLDQVSSSTVSAGRHERCDLSLGFPKRSPIAPEDVAIYETLSSEADAAFSIMESVYKANELSSWRTKNASELWTQAPVKIQRSSAVNGLHCIEITDADVLPFSKKSVFRAMWQCWEQQYAAKNCDVYELQPLSSSSSDTVAGRMRYDEYVDGERVPLETLFVLKLFAEADRICYVWRSKSTASTSVTEICVSETWWEELRTVPAQDGAVEGTLTLSCSHMESKTFAKSSATGAEAATDDAIAAPLLTSVLISSYEADVVDVTCRMMDLLLEETDSALVPRAARPAQPI